MKKIASTNTKTAQKFLRTRFNTLVELSDWNDELKNHHFADLFLKEAIKLSKVIKFAAEDEQKEDEIKEQLVDKKPENEYEVDYDKVEDVNPEPFESNVSYQYGKKDDVFRLLEKEEQLVSVPENQLADVNEILNSFKSKLAEGGSDISKCLFSLAQFVSDNLKTYFELTYDEDGINEMIMISLFHYFNLSRVDFTSFGFNTTAKFRDLINAIKNNTILPSNVEYMKELIFVDRDRKQITSNLDNQLRELYKDLNDNDRNILVDFWVKFQNSINAPNPFNTIKYFNPQKLLDLIAKVKVKSIVPVAFPFSHEVITLYAITRNLPYETIEKIFNNKIYDKHFWNTFRSKQSENILKIFNGGDFITFGLFDGNFEKIFNSFDFLYVKPVIKKLDKKTDIYMSNEIVSNFISRNTNQGIYTKSSSDNEYPLSFLTNLIMLAENDDKVIDTLQNTYSTYNKQTDIIAHQIAIEKDPAVLEALRDLHFRESSEIGRSEFFIWAPLLRCDLYLAQQLIEKIYGKKEEDIKLQFQGEGDLNSLPIFEVDCKILLQWLNKYLNFFYYEKQFNNNLTVRYFTFKDLSPYLSLAFNLLGNDILNYNPREVNFIIKVANPSQDNITKLKDGFDFEKIKTIIDNNKKIFSYKYNVDFTYESLPKDLFEILPIYSNNPAVYNIKLEDLREYSTRSRLYNKSISDRQFPYEDEKSVYEIDIFASLAMCPEGDQFLGRLIPEDAKLDDSEKLREIGDSFRKNKDNFYGNYRTLLFFKGLCFRNNISYIPQKYLSLSDNDLALILQDLPNSGKGLVTGIIDYYKNPIINGLEQNYKKLMACKASIAKSRGYSNLVEGSLQYNKILFAIYKNFQIRGRDQNLILMIFDIIDENYESSDDAFISYYPDLSDYYNIPFIESIFKKLEYEVKDRYEDKILCLHYLDLIWKSFGSQYRDNLKYIPENDPRFPEIYEKIVSDYEIGISKYEAQRLENQYASKLTKKSLNNFTQSLRDEILTLSFRVIQIFGNSTKIILDKVAKALYVREDPNKTFDTATYQEKKDILHDLGNILPENTEQNFKGLDAFIIRHYSLANVNKLMKISSIWNNNIQIYDENYQVVGNEIVRNLVNKYSLDELINFLTMSSIASLAENLKDDIKDKNFLMAFGSRLLSTDDDNDNVEYEYLDNTRKRALFIGCQDIYLAGLKIPLPSFAKFDKTINGVRMSFLPRNDPSGMFLGIDSGCCQNPLGYAASCAYDGHLNPRAAFCIWETSSGRILQAYTWSDENGNVCFDSFETIGGDAFYKSSVKKAVGDLLYAFGEYLGDKVVVGGSKTNQYINAASYGYLLKNPTKTHKSIAGNTNVRELLGDFSPNGKSFYRSDSDEQYLIYGNPNNVKNKIDDTYDDDDYDDEDDE